MAVEPEVGPVCLQWFKPNLKLDGLKIGTVLCRDPTVSFRCCGFEEARLRDAGRFAIYNGPADLLARYGESLLARVKSDIRSKETRWRGFGARPIDASSSSISVGRFMSAGLVPVSWTGG